MNGLNKLLADKSKVGNRVLVRVDWNVPVQGDEIVDSTRIVQTRETLLRLREAGMKVIVLSHYGRPTVAKKMRKNGDSSPELYAVEEVFSLSPFLDSIKETLGFELGFVKNPLADEGRDFLNAMQDGDVVLCENIRFFAGEEANDAQFAKLLAAFADFYVNEAFSCSHRAHASVEAIAHLLPSYAGFALEREVSKLSEAFLSPKRPLWAIVGGSKVSTKIDLLLNLSQKVDGLIIGGAMANTFLKAKGMNVGRSLVEDDYVATAQKILQGSKAEIVLPVDAVCSQRLSFDTSENIALFDADSVPDSFAIFDAGPSSTDLIEQKLSTAQTVIWNGPIGVFEHADFGTGTVVIAHILTHLTRKGVLTLAGGGDTLAALAKAGRTGALSYASTAGGAFLEFLEGKALPGIEALSEYDYPVGMYA
jgi:phosphoglycerate kinase